MKVLDGKIIYEKLLIVTCKSLIIDLFSQSEILSKESK